MRNTGQLDNYNNNGQVSNVSISAPVSSGNEELINTENIHSGLQ